MIEKVICGGAVNGREEIFLQKLRKTLPYIIALFASYCKQNRLVSAYYFGNGPDFVSFDIAGEIGYSIKNRLRSEAGRRDRMKKVTALILPVLLMVQMLGGCSLTKKYQVRYMFGDLELSVQEAAAGELPEPFVPEAIAGLRFVGWQEPQEAITADTVLHGIFVPELTNHVPFLEADADGFLHPDAPLTGDDLTYALLALGTEAAREYYPQLPSGENAVQPGVVLDLLQGFFPEREISLPAMEEDTVTRSAFACLMNDLLGRSAERVSPAGGQLDFPDVSPNRADREALLEAAAEHSSGKELWTQVRLQSAHAPGWELVEGKLRYFDEEGYLLADTELPGGFLLDADGWYTSGDKTLDGLVEERLAQYQQENPKADRTTLLRMAYDHCRDDYEYLRREIYSSGDTGWEISDAIEMFTTGKGNCYGYAAIFWALARGLGYDVTAIAGDISGESYWEDFRVWPHGWVKLAEGDKVYYFDPEMEMTERTQHYNFCDLFMKEVGTFNWVYFEPAQTNS